MSEIRLPKLQHLFLNPVTKIKLQKHELNVMHIYFHNLMTQFIILAVQGTTVRKKNDETVSHLRFSYI
jgi:hypothetical protein